MTTMLNHWRQVSLGLFVVWQLVYFAIANGLETLEIVTHRFPAASEAITRSLDECRAGSETRPLGPLSSLVFVVDKYGQLTEQPQRWSLFAPNISDQSAFLAYEFRWDEREKSVWLLSDDEPQDSCAYWRFLGSRMRSLEQNLTVEFAFDANETESEAQQRWSRQIREKLEKDFDVLIAWSALRLQTFQKDYPDAAPPDEVIIHVRGFVIAAPGANAKDARHEPYSLPLARWRPEAQYSPDVLPIEGYDPVSEEFQTIPWPIATGANSRAAEE